MVCDARLFLRKTRAREAGYEAAALEHCCGSSEEPSTKDKANHASAKAKDRAKEANQKGKGAEKPQWGVERSVDPGLALGMHTCRDTTERA